MNFILIFCLISVATFASAKPQFTGGPIAAANTQVENAAQIVKRALTKLACSGGPSLTFVGVKNISVQLVSGVLYKLDVDVADENRNIMTCNFEIWSQPWLKKDANQVTYNCPNGN